MVCRIWHSGVVFFFKQKTAYEVRISDWSSDVCSSDLMSEHTAADDAALRDAMHRVRGEIGKAVVGQDGTVTGLLIALLARGHVLLEGVPGVAKTLLVRSFSHALGLDTKRIRSEERRVGKEWVSTCSYRWSPYH